MNNDELDLTESKILQDESSEDMIILNLVFDSAPFIMIVVNQEGKVEKINQSSLEAFDTERDQALGLLGGELFKCINIEKGEGCGRNEECSDCVIRNSVMYTFQTSRSILKKETELLVKDHGRFSTKYMFISTTLMMKGTEPFVLLTVDDITEQKVAEKKLKESKEELRKAKIIADDANNAKSQFLANMSHELRTPLNSVIGFSDMLQSEIFGSLNEKQMDYVSNIKISGQHLLEIINDILDFSKIEAGKMGLVPEEFFVTDIIDETISILSPQASNKGISLESQMDLQVSTINADMAKFKQILYNLIGNAIKFTPKGGSVKVFVRNVETNLEVSIIDTGTGISKEDMERIFKPFTQLNSSLSRQQSGTGLGLVLVKKMVDMHGGNIEFSSELGKGSSFTFRLPLENKNVLN
ncbi:ATP-binding protein [Methanolobus sp. ZRKC3]|uniref:PAS domain-containing sensor histidine kinase n=1 Tax=Methanolobus sp. ZRKC3 TaxID=3125786 RepID=UPI003244C811